MLSRKRLNFDIVLKADRRIYLLLLVIFLHSCRDGDIQKLSALKNSPQKEKYVPAWHPPQVSEEWVTYEPSAEPQILEESELATPEAPIVLIKRDTIEGIAITDSVGGGETWQYSLDGGASWNDFGDYSETSALLLGADDLIRYHPDGNNGELRQKRSKK